MENKDLLTLYRKARADHVSCVSEDAIATSRDRRGEPVELYAYDDDDADHVGRVCNYYYETAGEVLGETHRHHLSITPERVTEWHVVLVDQEREP